MADGSRDHGGNNGRTGPAGPSPGVTGDEAHILVRDLDMAYGDFIVQRDLTFRVEKREVFVIMGPSGCGKSTLLRYLIGLRQPSRGEILFHGRNLCAAGADERATLTRCFGVLYQSGALWSSKTLAENVALPLEQHTRLRPKEIRELVSLKLALVGLAGFEGFYPSEISGGMKKRAGLARAMALDPEILFFDEPSAGLDPISSRLLDDLILELRDSLDTTIVVVTHELASIFAIADSAIYLDAEAKTITASGRPQTMLEHEPPDSKVRRFLTRGETDQAA